MWSAVGWVRHFPRQAAGPLQAVEENQPPPADTPVAFAGGMDEGLHRFGATAVAQIVGDDGIAEAVGQHIEDVLLGWG